MEAPSPPHLQPSTTAADDLRPADPYRLERATQRVRTHQSKRTLPLIIGGGCVFIYTLWNEAPHFKILAWIGPIFALTFLRSTVCTWVEARTDAAGANELHVNEIVLGLTSGLLSITVGAGFWLVAGDGTERAVMVVTILCCVYAFGSLINSSVHFKSFAVVTVLNLGQGILFLAIGEQSWLPAVGTSLVAMLVLMLIFGRENAAMFASSVKINAENISLARQLRDEKNVVEDALAGAREANAAKSRFLAAASHDLRQPLHAMSLFIGSLEPHIQSAEGSKIVERLEDAADALRDLFNALLDLSLFDAESVVPEIEAFRLDALLQRVVENIRPDAESKGLSLSLTAAPLKVESDKRWIESVMSNLLTNAVKYTDRGGIDVSAVLSSGVAVITIKDSGPGIDPANHEIIFNDFTQLDTKSKQTEQGIGLGLAIVKRINQMLELRLELTSAKGSGTQFSFRLPVVNGVESTEDNKAHITGDRSSEKKRTVVWAIDDRFDVVQGYAAQLGRWGCDVTTGQSRDDIDKAYAQQKAWPDLILLDDMLGGGDSGLDIALSLIEKIGRHRIAIVTGNQDERRLRDLEASGFRILRKPTSPEQLHDLVESA